MSTTDRGGERVVATPAQFTHDCDKCQYLGRSEDGTHDLYACESTAKDVTYIARFGDYGAQYTSCMDFILNRYAEDHPEAFNYCIEARALLAALSGGRHG